MLFLFCTIEIILFVLVGWMFALTIGTILEVAIMKHSVTLWQPIMMMVFICSFMLFDRLVFLPYIGG
jgi:hypothetical protein